jgi:hypothetical protein
MTLQRCMQRGSDEISLVPDGATSELQIQLQLSVVGAKGQVKLACNRSKVTAM